MSRGCLWLQRNYSVKHFIFLYFTVCYVIIHVMHIFTLQQYICYMLLLLLKKVFSARLRESDVHPISPETPAPQYQPIDRKKTKGKRVENYSRDRAA